MQTRTYTPHPSSLPFHNSHAQVKALCGAVGSGKSSAICWELYLTMREAEEPLHCLVLRESQRQLHDSTRRTWEYWFGHCSSYMRTDEKMLVTVENVDGNVLVHELDFRHARRPEEASNLMSTEYAQVWLEEVVPAYQMTDGVIGAGLSREIFDMVLMRLRQQGAHRLNVLLSFNPPHKYHWVYKEFFDRKPGELEALDYALFRAPAFENTANLPPGYYEKLLKRLDPDLARRFVLGEPVTLFPGVRVFPECFETQHIRDWLDVVPGVELVIGFDFGLTPVALICQVTPHGQLRVYREVQLFNAGVKTLAVQLQEALKDRRFAGLSWRCWGDPSGASMSPTDEKTCFQILAANGFEVQPGAITWEARRNSVKNRFTAMVDGEPAIQIDQSGCETLATGLLGGYRYPKSTDGRVSPKPLKNQFSHVNDALQYLCTGEFALTDGSPLQDPAARSKPTVREYSPLDDDRPAAGRGSWMAN